MAFECPPLPCGLLFFHLGECLMCLPRKWTFSLPFTTLLTVSRQQIGPLTGEAFFLCYVARQRWLHMSLSSTTAARICTVCGGRKPLARFGRCTSLHQSTKLARRSVPLCVCAMGRMFSNTTLHYCTTLRLTHRRKGKYPLRVMNTDEFSVKCTVLSECIVRVCHKFPRSLPLETPSGSLGCSLVAASPSVAVDGRSINLLFVYLMFVWIKLAIKVKREDYKIPNV